MASAGLHITSSNKHSSLSSASPSPTKTARSDSETIVVVPSPTSSTSTPHECNYSHWQKIVKGLPEEDPEENTEIPLHGWPELAQLITKHSDLEAFQPFRELHIKSLLYYQAELDGLKNKLHYVEWDDHRNGEFKQAGDLGKSVDKLLECEQNKTAEGRLQLELVKKMGQVLKEYSELDRQCCEHDR